MKRFLPLLSFYLFCISIGFSQPVLYVKPGGTGNGASWANASGNLRTILSGAAAGTQVWVAAGTYYPVTCTNCSATDRSFSFEIKTGVSVYGGFAGNETMLDQRDWQSNQAILSGDIDGDNTLANNAYNVIYTQGVSEATLLDGFMITGGNADLSSASLGSRQNSGAGWYNDGSSGAAHSNPQVRNCTFQNNQAVGYGGAMYSDGGFSGDASPSLEQCVFSDNVAGYDGGAVCNNGEFSGQSNPTYTNCTFSGNQATQPGVGGGGAVYNIGVEGVCSPVFSNCLFSGNNASYNGGAVRNFGKTGVCSPQFSGCVFQNNSAPEGGAFYNDGTFSGICNPVFSDCVFDSNLANTDGAGIYNSGYDNGDCSPSLLHCLFKNNHSLNAGAGLFNNGISGNSSPTLVSCRFLNNQADTYGAAMYNHGKSGNSSPHITNCIFSGNSASSAGAIYNLGSESGHANAVITNCTFYGNHANVGGAIYCNANDVTGNSSPEVSNCIFYQNSANFGKIFRCIQGTPHISYSLVDTTSCEVMNSGAGSNVMCGNGMIYNQDPKFVDAANGNFHLLEGSPAIDMGNDSAINGTNVLVDIENLPRISNGVVDMGAYEYLNNVIIPPSFVEQPLLQLELCAGSDFQVHIQAEGTPPLSYQWYYNGMALSGQTGDTLALNAVQANQSGYYQCGVSNASGVTVYSDSTSLNVDMPLSVGIYITASDTSICPGDPVVFTAHPDNAGTNPVFQWLVNGQVAGSNGGVYSTSLLDYGDVVSCEVTSSENCVVSPEATSAPVEMDLCTDVHAAPRGILFTQYPNPSEGVFTFIADGFSGDASLQIRDTAGNVVYSEFIPAIQSHYNQVITLNDPVPGLYFVRWQAGSLFLVRKIIVVNTLHN